MAVRRSRGPAPAVLVVGSANLDIVIPVEKLPAPGETVLGGERRDFFGGKGANQAVAAARAGARVRFVCLTGADEAGASYRRRLVAEGVEKRGLLTASAPTGTALILVDARGGNQIAVSPGANALLSPRRLRREGDIFGFGDIVLAQLEIPRETVALAFRAARRRGARTILNPAPAREGIPARLLRLVDVIVPNETEAALLCGVPLRSVSGARVEALAEMAGCLRRKGPRAAVVTAGARGAVFCSEEGTGWVRPPGDIVPVDTTGAGDAFSAALSVRLAEGAGCAESVRFAAAAAALSVRRRGAQEGLPRRRSILRAMKEVRLEWIRGS